MKRLQGIWVWLVRVLRPVAPFVCALAWAAACVVIWSPVEDTAIRAFAWAAAIAFGLLLYPVTEQWWEERHAGRAHHGRHRA